MSLDSFLYSDEQLAGPSYDSHSLSPITPTDFSSHSLSPQPNFHTPFSQKTPTDIGPFDAKALHPRFCYPDCDTETTGKMAQFYCPRVRSVAYNDDFVISSCVRPGESGFESGEKETIFQVCPKVESSECHDILQCPIWSNIPHQEELTFPHPCPSLVNLSSFEAPIVPESPKAVQFVTPKFKGVDENCSQASLSPYAPMPLPPIFCLPVESQTSTQHLPLDSTLTCTRSPFWSGHTASEQDKILPIDPVLLSCLPTEHRPRIELDSPADAHSMHGPTPEGLGFPSLPLTLSTTVARDRLSLNSKNVSLEVAKRLAWQFRTAASGSQLTMPFLMSFMGQHDSHSPHWSCYIQNCGKQLARKSHMVDHIKMHLDERVFACEHCPQTFLRKADCKRHLVAHNPGKAFQCNICLKSFGRKDLLTRHRRKCEQTSNKGQMTTGAINEKLRNRKRIQSNTKYLASSKDFQRDLGTLDASDCNKENIAPFLWHEGFIFTHENDGEGRQTR